MMNVPGPMSDATVTAPISGLPMLLPADNNQKSKSEDEQVARSHSQTEEGNSGVMATVTVAKTRKRPAVSPPTQTDRDRESESVDVTNRDNVSSQKSRASLGSEGVEPVADKAIDIHAILDNLKKHLSNEKKFSKALKLYGQVIPHLNAETWSCFMDVMTVITHSTTWKSGSAECAEMIKALFDQSQGISIPRRDAFWVKSLFLFGHMRQMLLTDDSYAFSKSASKLKCLVFSDETVGECSDMKESEGNGDLITERIDAILLCLKAAFGNYQWQWSRSDVDSLFQAASERRKRLFGVDDACMCKFDGLMSEFTTQQRRLTSWTGPKTVRAMNSIAHPLTHKSGGFFR